MKNDSLHAFVNVYARTERNDKRVDRIRSLRTSYQKFFLLVAICFCATSFLSENNSLKAQKVAIKNNIVYDVVKTPNLALEFAIGRKWTVDTQFGANFFFYKTDPTADSYQTTKWSHWGIQPELRWWQCDVFNGWFVGLHAHGGQMNVSGINIPLILENKDDVMKDHRYEGYFYGAGLSTGYQWILSPRFNIEASLGVGYARFEYTKFKCGSCGEKVGEGGANYVGPTKATLSLIFLLK